ncbi:putative ubiquinone biosynthesis monooxygenase [Irineochytrium annulatum]|nr:putative ubiquinone biosynthesis monooxygenase [Irineochytrium annulatum]
MSKLYDVVVVGGGAVGSAMCAALGKFVPSAGLKVAMVEAGDLYAKARRDAGVYSNRVSSINEDTVAFLKNVGAWDRIDTDRKRPFRTMEVWDGKGNGKVNFGATGQPTGDGLSSIAWIIENSMLTESLASSLDPGITVYNRAKVQAIKQEDDTTGWPEVQLQDGTILKTRLLVGADGANSVVRKFAKIETTGWDYAQNAIVATMRVQSEEMPPNYTAYQRFLKHGPIALLPLTSTDFARFVDVAFRNPIQDIDFLCDQVTDDGRVNVDVATEAEWGRARDPSYLSISVLNDFAGSRAQFPLRLRNSLEYVKDRVALVG